MIGRRKLPPDFVEWNARWRAPFGRDFPIKWFNSWRFAQRYRGPFAHQTNSQTRRFEYPWAFHTIERIGRNLDIVDIGGGLSGLQFVLAAAGHRVVNVDPGAHDGSIWGFTPESHASLARVFKAPVRLLPVTLAEASLPDQSADVVMSISVLEHLERQELMRTAREIRRVLRPDGKVVLTIDLFLNLAPFSEREEGKWGRNVNVREFLEIAGLELVSGHRSELFGFEKFRPEAILAAEKRYLVSKSRSTAQCLVARLCAP
jgi:SAM-dependent methyltransferase